MTHSDADKFLLHIALVMLPFCYAYDFYDTQVATSMVCKGTHDVPSVYRIFNESNVSYLCFMYRILTITNYVDSAFVCKAY